ncbi:hypothetical protein [Thermosipho sp. (in: thermotogales)]|jgi:hypothetical protein|uniref:hypothetical protein n=1 Tax=Thermosipho sp. (in: thermotogales) TaxID=1968895 RepID=UPI00257BFCF6|nr:hypothetical protein [Thermosipho sp. (in: thermotogales)]MBZ4649237.1 hypothetical protein [Thermosipho sp. (in: thermotogales)]
MEQEMECEEKYEICENCKLYEKLTDEIGLCHGPFETVYFDMPICSDFIKKEV